MNEKKWAAVLLGPPGSGKTSVVRELSGRDGVSTIQAGNLLEAEVRLQTPLGLQIQPYKTAGELVPLELISQVISLAMEKAQDRLVLFDGFPRSIEQVDLFLKLLKNHGRELCGVLVLPLKVEIAIKRLGGRRVCADCDAVYHLEKNPPRIAGICDRCGGKLIQRNDDGEEVIRRRFETYDRETSPVIDFFKREHPALFREQSSDAPLGELLQHVRTHLESFACGFSQSCGTGS